MHFSHSSSHTSSLSRVHRICSSWNDRKREASIMGQRSQILSTLSIKHACKMDMYASGQWCWLGWYEKTMQSTNEDQKSRRIWNDRKFTVCSRSRLVCWWHTNLVWSSVSQIQCALAYSMHFFCFHSQFSNAVSITRCSLLPTSMNWTKIKNRCDNKT